MRSVKVKLYASVALIALSVLLLPFVGITESESDVRTGLVLDFGYWDTQWVEMDFPEGMNGKDVIEKACIMLGYDAPVWINENELYSVNDQVNLVGVKWGFYVQDGGQWVPCDVTQDISKYHLVSWSRTSGPSAMIPGSDQSGFEYYSYARDGISMKTGEPLRIVCLAPSVTETLCAVGGLEYIVGTDLYSNYPEEVVDRQKDGTITITGGYTDPNYEWIVQLNPDIVFCEGGTGQHVTMADKLRKSNIDCVILYDATDISKMYNNIWIAASSLGLEGTASAVIQDLRSIINDVSGIAGDTNKRTFAALSADPSPWTAGAYTFMSDIISSAGGKNVFESQSSAWFMVSKEQIYAKQPRVIIIISSNIVDTEEKYQGVLDSLDPMWKSTPAYKDGNVYVFSGTAGDILSRPGPRLAQAAELVCKILNPEAFAALDPLDVIPKYFDDTYTDYLTYQKGVDL